MTYWDRLKTLAKGFGREINHAWDEAEHPRGKTSPASTPGSFAPKTSSSNPQVNNKDWTKSTHTPTPAQMREHGQRLRRNLQDRAANVPYADQFGQAYVDDLARLYGTDYVTQAQMRALDEFNNPAEAARTDALDAAAAKVTGEGAPVHPTTGEAKAKATADANVADALKRSLAYKNPHGDKIGLGTILYRSWGYDQTNINYYQVVGMSPTGKTVKIREIAQIDRGASGPMSGKTRAVPNAWIGDRPMTRRVNVGYRGQPGVNFNSYSSLSIWNGEDQYHSWDH